MKGSNEFSVGKHGIGYVGDQFKTSFGDVEFGTRPMPTFQKLPRSMNDAAIESELKPGLCELGDVLAFIDNAPQECKDGNWNLFYFPAFVVSVFWFGGEWYVGTWDRDGHVWYDVRQVFSPATGRSSSCHHCCSCALELRLSELEAWKQKVEKVLNV